MIANRKLSKPALALMAVASVVALSFVQHSARYNIWHKYKISAALSMQKAIGAVTDKIKSMELPINAKDDPNGTGLVGPKNTVITTDVGILDAKVMVINPDFAAVIVDLFKQAGVSERDTIAIAYTGSMPGANIALLSAAQAMNLKPIIISSLGSSQWGATNPEFTWLDMESYLFKKGIFNFKSIAASLGGQNDMITDKSDSTMHIFREIINRNDLPIIFEEDRLKNTQKRLVLYDRYAAGKPIKAFVNIGGGVGPLGEYVQGQLIPTGVSMELPLEKFSEKGVIVQMSKRNIPVIHILKVRNLVFQYSLPALPPKDVKIGNSDVYLEKSYNVFNAFLVLVVLLIFIIIIVELDIFILPKILKNK